MVPGVMRVRTVFALLGVVEVILLLLLVATVIAKFGLAIAGGLGVTALFQESLDLLALLFLLLLSHLGDVFGEVVSGVGLNDHTLLRGIIVVVLQLCTDLEVNMRAGVVVVASTLLRAG